MFCDMDAIGKMISSPCRMTIMALLIGKVSQAPLHPQVTREKQLDSHNRWCALSKLLVENPRSSWFIGPKLDVLRGLINKDMVYRQTLLVLSNTFCLAIFWGEFSAWNLSWWGGLEKDAICAHDDECHHGDFTRGPFYIFSGADFPFHTF